MSKIRLISKIRLNSISLVLVLLSLTITTNAQNYSITGTLRSLERTTGNPIANVRIDVDSSSYVTRTNAIGNYTLKNIPAGVHNIRMSTQGFIGICRKDFTLTKDTIYNVCLADTMQESPSGELVLKLDQLREFAPYTALKGLLKVNQTRPNGTTWKDLTEGNLIPMRIVNATHLDSLHFLNALGACDGDGDWSDSPVTSIEYKQKRELYKLIDDPSIDGWTKRGVLVGFNWDGNFTLRTPDVQNNNYIFAAEIHLWTNMETTIQKEAFGRIFNRGDIGGRPSYMNGIGNYSPTDLDHMLNIVFFNQWAAMARLEQQSNILDMEDKPLFGIPASTTITTPVNNSVDLEKTVTISWKNIFSTDRYRLQIATDDQFTDISMEKLVFRKDTLITLQNDKDYYTRVRTENLKGSSDWSTTVHFQTKSIITGTGDNLIADKIRIYPNPANNFLVIDLSECSDTHDYSIKILNIMGKVVFETKAKPKYEINTSNWLGKGIYVLQVYDNNKIIKATKKIILQ
jgi:hypothetical protein